MPDAYSPLSAVVTWGPLTLHGLAAAEPIAPLLLSGPRPDVALRRRLRQIEEARL